MPKPLKKKPVRKKSTTPKRPASDPNLRVHQQMAEHLERMEKSSPPWKAEPEPATTPGDTFRAQLSAHMSAIGTKGGLIGGKRRLQTMTAAKRREVAKKAAIARWGPRRGK